MWDQGFGVWPAGHREVGNGGPSGDERREGQLRPATDPSVGEHRTTPHPDRPTAGQPDPPAVLVGAEGFFNSGSRGCSAPAQKAASRRSPSTVRCV